MHMVPDVLGVPMFDATNSFSNSASLSFTSSAVNINMLAVSYVKWVSASTQTFFPFTQWDFTFTAGFKCRVATLFNFLYKQFESSDTKNSLFLPLTLSSCTICPGNLVWSPIAVFPFCYFFSEWGSKCLPVWILLLLLWLPSGSRLSPSTAGLSEFCPRHACHHLCL